MRSGRLVGIGVGPGDPELMTLKAVRAIGECPVVAFVSAGGRPSLARRIAATHIGADQREVNIALPMNLHPEIAQAAYDEGASRITAELEQGLDVALLCEGDPLLFGSFIQFLARIGPRYACRVIPGVTSVSAAAAAAQMPLVWRQRSLVVLPATLPVELLEDRLRHAEAAAILKVGRHLEAVRDVLARL
ncbi:MAG: precorrin-2 C(20)-methyltransferase, partial [Geminicoccaceae bacterium]|nr:precorrin-2 C(20)-methyltransferase [Geminicoccaceae bacterium]